MTSWRGEIRRARPDDAPGIAAVHVASWHSAYRDLLPPAYVAAHTREVREQFWADALSGDADETIVFVACDPNGNISGFASGGPERSGGLGVRGELYSLYLADRVQGMGLGRRLAERTIKALTESRLTPIAVWVLSTNPARGFYERLGAEYLTEREAERHGVRFSETAYRWPA